MKFRWPQWRQWRQWPVQWLALGAGTSAALIALVYFGYREAELTRRSRPIAVPVAAAAISAGTILTPSRIAIQSMPQAFVPPGAPLQVAEVVGLVARHDFAAGEVLTMHRLQSPQRGHQLAAFIPPGHRAVAIPIDATHASGGLIAPHDRVDLLASFDFGSGEQRQSYIFTLWQDLEVLSVGPRLPGGETLRGAAARTVTVAVEPAAVAHVLFAIENGTVFLALRAPEDVDVLAEPQPATAASVTGMSSLIKRSEYRGR